MTAFYDDPDAAIAKVQRDIADAQERARRAGEVKASIDRVRGRMRSSRGEVEAEVDATGRLTDLVLADAATALRPDDLAALIRETVDAAARDAGRRAVAVTDDAYGEGSAISGQLRAELDAREVSR
ncbi:YbaB/EbfC family nucleoid-associated protein [Cellulomonas chengniuliangii]|uniref:YbaB/EbfC family nucleoid-associated protein n=1 Tax=Cellulomonas chengniuliangii TaxID=2968084 RepID=A0ABY5L1D3_9CELL|nr:YbaB/EbfC family nucleoid-associated protein [Cellulomonas chengniuliangii]MCC2307975.1 YbaB/EbfC family nucleoid-associated protein [Cellulomonas chengniuliangii]MCC2318495.1 YbaB/EbfC family nucleoid-associated protein [Cellulomonas chengniuliangii]UUI75276.1 YbaB/EbfC family nucleoid-associated protein [Cellulomonas chengniuliangii]